MMNSRQILRWLLTGFLFGTGWAAAKVIWTAVAGVAVVLLPVIAVLVLAGWVFSLLNPLAARRAWEQGKARALSAVFFGRAARRPW